jgi:hypothetical protein
MKCLKIRSGFCKLNPSCKPKIWSSLSLALSPKGYMTSWVVHNITQVEAGWRLMSPWVMLCMHNITQADIVRFMVVPVHLHTRMDRSWELPTSLWWNGKWHERESVSQAFMKWSRNWGAGHCMLYRLWGVRKWCHFSWKTCICLG